MIQCINLANPAQVEALDIKYRRNNLVHQAGRKPKKYDVIVRGRYYLRKGITAQQGKKLLDEISNRLNKGWTIEIV